ncbi:DUF456 domain-containing protein [Halanaerobium salsuginis]|jgi:hypothetical protein|uniref:DUF456 domain-containing protein n=1 Tax=Halanaerobium salsuginis TaxID=29563 RepID=A0A1I4H9S3_9FIRM|nr:DUF456 domain-containing protein [Halanaerobium salsuginis]SFL38357.1 hypothetical protein SAMN02983006_01003 [Halanaerobium salsuginis]
MDIFLIILVLILFSLEIIAIFLPVLPEGVFFWLAIILYKFIKVDLSYSIYFWIAAIIVTILLFLADYLAGAYFIKKRGGSNKTILAAGIGIILGALFLGPLGFIIGPFLTIFILEFYLSRNKNKSFQIALSSIFALITGTTAKLILELFLMIWFLFIIF